MLNSQLTVTLYIVEELREIFNIKLYIYGKNIKSYGSNHYRKACQRKKKNPVRTLTSHETIA